MSQPDLVTAVRRFLVAQVLVTTLVGTDDDFDHWIFQWENRAVVERSGTSAVVLSQRGSWTSPNEHNNMKFPRLQIEIFSDVSRNSDGAIIKENAYENAREVFLAIDRFLHRPQGGMNEWGATDDDDPLEIYGSLRLDEPDYSEVPSGDGVVRALAYYGITTS